MEVVKVPEMYQGILAITTSEIPNYFVGIGKQQAIKYVSEMYVHPDFSDGVIRPTQKTTLVLPNRFLDFLRFKEEKRFK